MAVAEVDSGIYLQRLSRASFVNQRALSSIKYKLTKVLIRFLFVNPLCLSALSLCTLSTHSIFMNPFGSLSI